MTDRGLKPKHLKEPLSLVQKEVENLLGLLERGGKGSGHFGHAGRPGEVGGSRGSGATPAGESLTEKFEKSLEKIGQRIDVWQLPIAASAWITSGGKLYVVNYSHQSALSLAWTRDVERDLTGEQRQELNDWASENYWSEEFDPGLLYYYFLSKLKWVRVIAERTSHTGTNLSRLNVNLSRQISRSAAKTLKDLTLYYESEYDNEPLFDFVDEAFEKREGINELFSAIGVTRGGIGSGHFGHAGRPGEVGGSQSGSGKKKLSRSGAQSVAVTSPKRVAPCLRKLLTNEEIELWHQGMTRGMRSFSPRRVQDESFDESWIDEDGLVYKAAGRTHDGIAQEGLLNTRIEYRDDATGKVVQSLYNNAEVVANMLGWLRLSGSRFESAISFHTDVPPTDEQIFSAIHMIAKGGTDKLEEFHWEAHNHQINDSGWWAIEDATSGIGAISLYRWLDEHSPMVARSLLSLIERHYGPGPHPGTGTPQSVHGGNGSPTSNVMSSADAHKFKGTLFHGTHRKHLQSVSEIGLVPGIGPMVEWAYGEYMDEEYNHPETGESMIPELLYFTGPRSPEMGTQDDSSIAKAFAFVYHSIAYDKYDGDSSKVTWEDIREHGLLVAVGKEDLPGGLYLRGENEEFYEVNLDWDTEQVGYTELPYFDQYHTGPEPGDYFTPHNVSATTVIYGDELVRLGKALESKWPEAMLAGQMLLPLEFRNLIIERHYGPGPHPGTGTPQSVHGGGSGLGEFNFGGSPSSRNSIRFSISTMRALREGLNEEQIEEMRTQFIYEVERSLIEMENALGVPIEGLVITNSLEDFFIHDGTRGFDNPNTRQDLLEIIREKSIGWKGAYTKGLVWLDDTPTAWGTEKSMEDPFFHRIIYHEVGHYLTTDLDRAAGISSFAYYALMKDYDELQPSHEWLVNMEPLYGSNKGTLRREYRADLIAAKVLSAASDKPIWARGLEGERPALKPEDITNMNFLYSSLVNEFQNKYPNADFTERSADEETMLVFFPAAGEIVVVLVSSLDELPPKAVVLDQIFTR
jgi:hypothetical protein